jgi:hypothetical protein
MPDALAQPLQRWHDFYLLVGGAAATLVGLMFLAISLGSQLITPQQTEGLRVFVTPTVIHFIYVLAIAMVSVIPTLTRTPLGMLLVFAGLFSIGRTCAAVPYVRQQFREGFIDRSDWFWYVVTPLLSYLMLVGTGASLLLGASQALSGLAVATLVLLVSGIRNAWDMVVWFAVKVESPPR